MINKKLWKEDRVGAVSLIYDRLDASNWSWVIEHHSSVGIRGCGINLESGCIKNILADKKWDLTTPELSKSNTLIPCLGGGWPVPIPFQTSCQLNIIIDKVESVMSLNQGVVWRWDNAEILSIGKDQHRALLQWLGSQHMRIWCAPLSNIHSYFNQLKITSYI